MDTAHNFSRLPGHLRRRSSPLPSGLAAQAVYPPFPGAVQPERVASGIQL
jgi:hypothetical protein